jgi:hypothetical protein
MPLMDSRPFYRAPRRVCVGVRATSFAKEFDCPMLPFIARAEFVQELGQNFRRATTTVLVCGIVSEGNEYTDQYFYDNITLCTVDVLRTNT